MIKILKILVKKFEHSVQNINISNLVKRLKISFKILNIISSKCHSKSRGYGRIFVEIRKNLCQNLNIIRYSFKCSLNFDQNLINFDSNKIFPAKPGGGVCNNTPPLCKCLPPSPLWKLFFRLKSAYDIEQCLDFFDH